MKRIVTSLLAVCLIVSALAALTACQHKCEYATDWTHDDTSHWHKCSDEKCTLVADKATHTWDNGVITAEPTQEASGTKTFTCTVCQKKYTEGVAFTGLSRETWNGIISNDSFENFTMKEVAVVKTKGITVETKSTYYATATELYRAVEAAGETYEEHAEGEEAKTAKKELVDSLIETFDFDLYKYDAESKTYKVTKETEIVGLEGSKTSDAIVRFENGKPVEYTCTGKMTQNGVEMDVEYTIIISDYGTTKIPADEGNI